MTMASHVGVLDHGRLVQFGTPRDVYESPSTAYVAARLGQPRINLLPADLFGAAAPQGAVQIGLRPEHVQIGDGKEAQVVRVERLGDQTRLHLSLAGHDVVTLTDPHTPLESGQSIAIASKNPLFFDSDGLRIKCGGDTGEVREREGSARH